MRSSCWRWCWRFWLSGAATTAYSLRTTTSPRPRGASHICAHSAGRLILRPKLRRRSCSRAHLTACSAITTPAEAAGLRPVHLCRRDVQRLHLSRDKLCRNIGHGARAAVRLPQPRHRRRHPRDRHGRLHARPAVSGKTSEPRADYPWLCLFVLWEAQLHTAGRAAQPASSESISASTLRIAHLRSAALRRVCSLCQRFVPFLGGSFCFGGFCARAARGAAG